MAQGSIGWKRRYSRRFLACLIFFAAGSAAFTGQAQYSVPWPIDAWSASTPEEQGVDSTQLAAMLAFVEARDLPIHSLLIIRNGVLVLEAYRFPHNSETLHELRSCTKSVVSALFGMALAQGRISGIDQRIVECFPGRAIANLSGAKRQITLAHLLTMSGGFDWPGGMLEVPVNSQMFMSQDWVGFVLDRPMSDFPGTRFVYNSGGSHLLSAVVQDAVGTTTAAFADANLFRPLGIGKWYWSADPQGITKGGGGLWLRPADLARFGYLYLNGGRWADRQIVPESWVRDSCRRQITAGRPWLSDGYGYQWWVDDRGYVMALGYGGQYLILVPGRNLIMVALSGLRLEDYFVPEDLLGAYVLPASASGAALPPNPGGLAALHERVAALAGPETPHPPPPLPATALRISGNTYAMQPSPVGWTAIELTFREGSSSALFTADGVPLNVGLDGVFRATDPPPTLQVPQDARRMLRGSWIDADTFLIEFHIVGRPERYTETLYFQGDELTLREQAYITGEQYVTTGHALIRKNYRRKN